MKRVLQFFWRLILACALLSAVTQRAEAQNDVHVSGASYYVTLANTVPWNQINANYIFTPQSPNVGLCMFVENKNTTFTHSLTITAFQTGNPSLTGYAANPNLWAASTIVNNFASVGPASAKSVFINVTGAANVAVVITAAVGGSGSPDVANVFVVQSTVQQCGSANAAQIIMGVSPNGVVGPPVNPVVIAGYDYAGGNLVAAPAMTNDGVGNEALELANGQSIADDTASSQGSLANKSNGGPVVMVAHQLKASDGRWNQVKSIDQFNSVAATAAGNTALWNPGAGIKFRIECVSVDVTENATLAAAGEEVISLQDGSTGLPGFTWRVWIPATALTTSGELYSSGTVCFNDGYLSTTNANILNVNLGTALVTGHVMVRVFGVNN